MLTMKDRLGRKLSARRIARREKIMAVTLQLIAMRGYETVTVTELARESGVSKKTLYDIYGSKEAVVAASIAYRMATVSDHVDGAVSGRGLAHLLSVVRLVTASVLEFPMLSRSLGPMLIRDPGKFHIPSFYDVYHRRALEEMREDGELAPDVSIEFLMRTLMFELLGVQNLWVSEHIDSAQYPDFAIVCTCRTLLPAASPAMRDHLHARIEALQRTLSYTS